MPDSPVAIDPASVVRTRLANGLTVLIRRDRSAPVVAIVTYVSAGYFDETDDIVGIAHVLEHMYFKGTPTRGVGEIAKQTKAVGGYLNAAHDLRPHELLHGASVVGLCAGARRAGRRVCAFADRRRRAGARARGHHPGSEAQGGQSRRGRDGDAVRAAARPSPDSSLAHRSRAGAARADARRARRLLSQLLSSRQHGSVDRRRRRSGRSARRGATRVRRDCRPASRRGHPGQTEEGVSGFRYREMAGDIGQTQVAFGWRTPGTTHPDTRVARSPRGRARQRTRVAAVSRGARATPGVVGVGVQLHADGDRRVRRSRRNAARVGGSMRRARIWDQLRAVRDGDIGELEVERAKRIYESQFVRRLEDMEGQANYLAEWEALGDWRMGDRYLERLLTTTRDESGRRGESVSRSGQRRRHRVSPELEPGDCRGSRRAARAARSRRPRPRRCPRPRRTRRTRCRTRRKPDVRSGGSRRARLSHGERHADPRASQARMRRWCTPACTCVGGLERRVAGAGGHSRR